MHFCPKGTLAALALIYASTCSAAIKKSDLEYSFSIGWDLIGKLRSCPAFDTSRNYYLVTADVEKELLKFVRRSNLVESNYPELQADKVAVQATIAAEGLKGAGPLESKQQCQQAAGTDAPKFIRVC